MSETAAEMLKDRLNEMERNAYDGIDFRQDATAAYALADELGNERDQLKDENDRLRELVADMLNAWDDVKRETVTGPTFDDCEVRAYKMGIEI